MVRDGMSCRCQQEQWQRDYAKQRDLAKKTAVMLGRPQVIYRTADGRFGFVSEGEELKGEQFEIITQY